MSGTDQNGAVTTVRIDYSGGNNEHTLKDKEAAGLLTSRKVKLPNRRIATAYRKVQ